MNLQSLISRRVIPNTRQRGDEEDQSNLATASTIPYTHMTSICYCQDGTLYKETTKYREVNTK